MKYIKLFENFDNENILYKELSDNECNGFEDRHELLEPEEKTVSIINKFIKSEKSLKRFGLKCEMWLTMDSEDEDEDEDGGPYEIVIEMKRNNSMIYKIHSFNDDWFLVFVEKQDDEYNETQLFYECDTIDGVYQLIMQWGTLLNGYED